MKHIQLVCVCLLLSVSSIAQTKNSITFSGSILSSSSNAFADGAKQYYNLQSRVGYFLFDNFSFGLKMENDINQNQEVPFSLAGYTRLYFGKAEKKGFKLFMEMGAGAADNLVARTNDEAMMPQAKSKFQSTAYVSPGMNVFVGSAGLELAVEYKHINGSTKLNRLGVRAGLTFIITQKQFTKAFPYEFNGTY